MTDVLADSPLVVIFIPTYNSALTLGETLTSVLGQTYKNIRVHISDNCSSDSTLAVAATFSDPRIQIHKFLENVGGEGNFTRCMKMADGKYTAIFHADDIYQPRAVENLVQFLESHPNVEAVMSQAELINDASNSIGSINMIPSIPSGEARLYGFPELLKSIFKYQNRIVIASMLVRTQLFKNRITQWGDGSFKSASDVGMYLQIAEQSPIAVLGEHLIRYRISESQYSQRIRMRLTRPDFFLVTDAYIEKTRGQGILDSRDFRNLNWLVRHDKIARSMNAVIAGDVVLARQLLKGTLSFDAFHAAFRSRRGLVTLLASIFLHTLSAVGKLGAARNFVQKLKNVKWQ